MAGLADILVGNKSLPIRVVEIPSTKETEAPQKTPPEEPKQDSQ